MFENDLPFMKQCLNGDVDMDDISKFIEKWHMGHDQKSLHEFLGMTFEEYSVWVEKPSALPFILRNPLLRIRKSAEVWRLNRKVASVLKGVCMRNIVTELIQRKKAAMLEEFLDEQLTRARINTWPACSIKTEASFALDKGAGEYVEFLESVVEGLLNDLAAEGIL